MPPAVTLSSEQSAMVDAARSGRDVVVDACCGSGKTTAIQELCSMAGASISVLYLTYSKLLKQDAQRRVAGARVQNYHGIVYPSLQQAEIRTGISESINAFNTNFASLAPSFPRYDLLVVDEYQDITHEYAQLLRNIRSTNPRMQVVLVGDMAQRVRSDTTLNVLDFVSQFVDNPARIPFTQSFRLGPELAQQLSKAWNKPIVGVNEQQQVRYVDQSDVQDILMARRPGEVLCLGRRNGSMSEALNTIERVMPKVYNKGSVFASIRDGDSQLTYGDDTAIFTTFDSSKGLERDTSIVFDFDEDSWDVRHRFPGADHEVLRNIFLVAASRGKNDVVFVKKPGKGSMSRSRVGNIPVSRFTHLPEAVRPVYDKPWWASTAFDFKYAENVRSCFGLLAVKRLDDGSAEAIEMERSDGLIDLSPVVGHYQEAIFFDGWNAATELSRNPSRIAAELTTSLNGEPWNDCLVMAAVGTDQMRYARQVDHVVPSETRLRLASRLASELPRDATSQVSMLLDGNVVNSDGESTPVAIVGVADAIHEGVVHELKFVHELTHPMFAQLALYLVMGDYDSGVLWNVRTNERWEVTIPDRQAFMDSVVKCVTKQAYATFASSAMG